MKLVSIVEGDGDVAALAVLLRRWLADQGRHDVQVGRPWRVPRSKLIRQGGVESYVAMVVREAEDPRILVLVDADDDCPAVLGPALLQRIRTASSHLRCDVVLAKREFEAWFIGSIESLAGTRGLPRAVTAPADPESISDAKGWLADQSGSYAETIDQPAFAAGFDFAMARRRCPSFGKLERAVAALIAAS